MPEDTLSHGAAQLIFVDKYEALRSNGGSIEKIVLSFISLLFVLLFFLIQVNISRERRYHGAQKDKRKVKGVPQSQSAALPRPQEEEETHKSKQAQIEQTYEKH